MKKCQFVELMPAAHSIPTYHATKLRKHCSSRLVAERCRTLEATALALLQQKGKKGRVIFKVSLPFL